MSGSHSGFVIEATSASYLCFSRVGPELSAFLRKAWLIRNSSVKDGSLKKNPYHYNRTIGLDSHSANPSRI